MREMLLGYASTGNPVSAHQRVVSGAPGGPLEGMAGLACDGRTAMAINYGKAGSTSEPVASACVQTTTSIENETTGGAQPAILSSVLSSN
jgi:hypothetical protein